MIDLHTHSFFSDGSDSPAELLKKANAIGLSAIALTDHDVISGCYDFQKASALYPNVIAINGSELGVNHPANMEIIAMNIRNLEPYEERQKKLLTIRNEANLKRVKLLQKAGYKITWDDVAIDENGNVRKIIAKPHFAEYLLKSGQVKDKEFVYKNLLKKGGPAYVEKKDPDTRQTIDFIRQTGAVSVLAHPCLIHLTGQDLFNEIALLKSWGLQGMEVMHSDMTTEQMAEYNAMADTLGLLKSGGSDYHGKNAHPGVKLGVGRDNLNIPDVFLEKILKASS